MSPDIPPGSYLIFHHFIYRCLLTRGKLIKVQHPTYGLIVKKIIEIDVQGRYWLEGIAKKSITTHEMGAVDISMISGIVISSIKNKHSLRGK